MFQGSAHAGIWTVVKMDSNIPAKGISEVGSLDTGFFIMALKYTKTVPIITQLFPYAVIFQFELFILPGNLKSFLI